MTSEPVRLGPAPLGDAQGPHEACSPGSGGALRAAVDGAGVWPGSGWLCRVCPTAQQVSAWRAGRTGPEPGGCAAPLPGLSWHRMPGPRRWGATGRGTRGTLLYVAHLRDVPRGPSWTRVAGVEAASRQPWEGWERTGQDPWPPLPQEVQDWGGLLEAGPRNLTPSGKPRGGVHLVMLQEQVPRTQGSRAAASLGQARVTVDNCLSLFASKRVPGPQFPHRHFQHTPPEIPGRTHGQGAEMFFLNVFIRGSG